MLPYIEGIIFLKETPYQKIIIKKYDKSYKKYLNLILMFSLVILLCELSIILHATRLFHEARRTTASGKIVPQVI